MESMVDGRALTEGDREQCARAAAREASTHDDQITSSVTSRNFDVAERRAWHDRVTTVGCIPQERVLAEASRDAGIGLRVGKRRPLDRIERIDHDSISTNEILELLLDPDTEDASDTDVHHPLHHESDL